MDSKTKALVREVKAQYGMGLKELFQTPNKIIRDGDRRIMVKRIGCYILTFSMNVR